jgi:endonuclease YncB( thermonuclease family)
VTRTIASLAVALLCWIVNAQPVRVIDGDTFVAIASVWLASAGDQTVVERVRVLGVNAPELHGATKAAGEAAKAFTEQWLAGGAIRLEVCQRDSFGRLLATVMRADGRDLTEDLIAAGMGVPFQ